MSARRRCLLQTKLTDGAEKSAVSVPILRVREPGLKGRLHAWQGDRLQPPIFALYEDVPNLQAR